MFQYIDAGYQPEVVKVKYYARDTDGSIMRDELDALQIDDKHVIVSTPGDITLYEFHNKPDGPEIGDRSRVASYIMSGPKVTIDIGIIANLTVPELLQEIADIKRRMLIISKSFR